MSRRRATAPGQLALWTQLAPPAEPTAPPPPEDAPGVDEASRAAARAFAGDLVLRAGAGTGKTHTLVQVVVHLVAGATERRKPMPPARILLVTFSEKAAGELRERVRARFQALAEAPAGDRTLAAACARLGVALPDAAHWRRAAAQLGGAPISTFHGFARALLARHAAVAGLDGELTLLPEDEAEALLRTQAESAVLAALPDDAAVADLVRELDWSRPADGHTRGLVEHVVELVQRLAEGAGELARHGAADAAEARAALPGVQREAADALAALVATLAGAKGGLKERGQRLAELPLAALVGSEEDPAALPALSQALELSKGNLGNEGRNAARNRLRELEALWREHWVALRGGEMADALAGLAQTTARSYASAKQALGVLDFGDLVARASALLAGDPARRAAEAARWDAVLVDEFQDTNAEQDALITLVRGQAPLLVVGDPKQSIYEFRGADVATFDRVAARVEAAGGRSLALTESRRGRAPLTAFVNRLFARAMRGGQHAFEVAFDPERDALHSWRGGEGVCVELVTPPAEEDPEPSEAQLVARHLIALVQGGREVVIDADGRARPARWGDVAILFRRFTHLDEYLGELRRARIPHYVVNGRGFYEAQEVRDLVHALALLDDPADELALLGVLRSPLVGLSDRSLAALAEARGGRLGALPDAPVPGLPADEAERLARFAALVARLRAHADRLGAAGTLRALVEQTDLEAVLASMHYGEQRIANLEQLLGLAAEHDAAGRGDRRAFVRRLRAQTLRERSLAPPAQILGEREDVVRIMTIHQSKGLEFPVVLVPECNAAANDRVSPVAWDREVGLGLRLRLADGKRAPSPRARRAEEQRRARSQAESLRLFYVATTRARDLLVLLGMPPQEGAGAGGRPGSWWRTVHDLCFEDLDARALTRTIAPSRPVAAPAPAPRALRRPTADEEAAIARAFAPPATGPRAMVTAVTELATFAQCPRRWHLRHEVGLREWPVLIEDADRALRAVETAADAETLALQLDPTARGTLAHRLLERIDFAAGPDAILPLLAAEAPDLPDAERERLRALVAGVLASPLGRELAGRPAARILREAPFVLAAQGERCRLLIKGQMDLVLLDAEQVTVLDYKLTAHGDLSRYRFQLETYALAARAAWNRPARAGVVFLRPDGPRVRLLEDAADPTPALARLADDLAACRAGAQWPGRELPDCRRFECGYLARCHGAD